MSRNGGEIKSYEVGLVGDWRADFLIRDGRPFFASYNSGRLGFNVAYGWAESVGVSRENGTGLRISDLPFEGRKSGNVFVDGKKVPVAGEIFGEQEIYIAGYLRRIRRGMSDVDCMLWTEIREVLTSPMEVLIRRNPTDTPQDWLEKNDELLRGPSVARMVWRRITRQK